MRLNPLRSFLNSCYEVEEMFWILEAPSYLENRRRCDSDYAEHKCGVTLETRASK